MLSTIRPACDEGAIHAPSAIAAPSALMLGPPYVPHWAGINRLIISKRPELLTSP